MKRYGTVSYNLYGNFTNYGSALQSWALHQAINKLSKSRWEAVLVDYCPDILKQNNPLDPFKNMWDKDEEAVRNCTLSMSAIRENFYKFDRFYKERFVRTNKKYTSENFNSIIDDEKLDGFVCGSDTIFCIDEFGFDDGYYAEFDCMKNGYTVSYAASFGDSHFTDETYSILNERLQNFNAIGLRENQLVEYVRNNTDVNVQRVIDPTLLLKSEDYDKITSEKQIDDKYLLIYSRRYNPAMEEYAQKLADENGWKIVDISLRATNADKGHIMSYSAGVEEFLSLVKHSEFVVTNSYHGLIFSVQFERDFVIFSREQCDTKIQEVLELFGISDRKFVDGKEKNPAPIDYSDVKKRIEAAREKSLEFLKTELEGCK